MLRQCDDVDLTLVKNNELNGVDIQSFDKLIISPGPDLPSAAGDLMGFIAQHVRDIPILGICLGHQAIVKYFGGTLEQYDNPKHGEKTSLVIKEGALFDGLPNRFEVGLYHSWYVSKHRFPTDLIITAQNEEGVIMATQHKTLNIHSVQFHPESYMSNYGLEILQNFIYSS